MHLLKGCLQVVYMSMQGAFPIVGASKSKIACTMLLMRLINDLRSMWILFETGYDIQANCIAGSLYECCFSIATIGDNDDLATTWFEHDDPIKSFMSAKDLTEKGTARYGASPEWVPELYRIYRQLCWGKHLNPFFQQQGGMEFGDKTLTYMPGPHSDELTERGIWFGCIKSALLTSIAISVYLRCHVLDENRAELELFIKEIGAEYDRLDLIARERWGGPDPFPGRKW
jgi:hypothetical protein